MIIDKNDKLSPLSGGGTPTQDSNHGDTDMRLSITSQSIQSVVSVKDSHFASKRRCRDFDGIVKFLFKQKSII